MTEPDIAGIPLFIGLACCLLFGHIIARVFGAARLPGVVGLILAGLVFRFTETAELGSAVNYFSGVAFFLVLATAGLDISPADVDVTTTLLALIPFLMEAAFVAIFVFAYLDPSGSPLENTTWTVDQGLALGVMVAPFEDGIMLPILTTWRELPLGPLPRRIFTASPIEGAASLFVFEFISSFGAKTATPIGDRIGVKCSRSEARTPDS